MKKIIFLICALLAFGSVHAQEDEFNVRVISDHIYAEHLYRDDHIYDIICVLNYNTSPIIPGRGSAIFLHIAKPDFSGTEGCIAIERGALIEIAINLTKDSTIRIEN